MTRRRRPMPQIVVYVPEWLFCSSQENRNELPLNLAMSPRGSSDDG
jgi:hypothetical protein